MVKGDFILLPHPRELTFAGTECDLLRPPTDRGVSGERRRFIRLGSGDAEPMLRIGRAVKKAVELVSEVDLELTAGGSDAAVIVDVDPNLVVEPEGYELNILRNQIRLVSRDAAGAFYGAQTLLQIARQ